LAAALAHGDPIDLTIKTNFDFDYVVDCVSQAVNWLYFGEALECLFSLSLGGARDIAILLKWLDEVPEYKAAIEQTIKDASTRLNMSQEALTVTFRQIASNPQSRFLSKI
jgi:hypothetical protein